MSPQAFAESIHRIANISMQTLLLDQLPIKSTKQTKCSSCCKCEYVLFRGEDPALNAATVCWVNPLFLFPKELGHPAVQRQRQVSPYRTEKAKNRRPARCFSNIRLAIVLFWYKRGCSLCCVLAFL